MQHIMYFYSPTHRMYCAIDRAPWRLQRRSMNNKGITGVIPPPDLAQMTALTKLYVRAAALRRPRAPSVAVARAHLAPPRPRRPHRARRPPPHALRPHARAPGAARTRGVGGCTTTSSADRSRPKSAIAWRSRNCACAQLRSIRPRAPSPAAARAPSPVAARAHLAPPRLRRARRPPSLARTVHTRAIRRGEGAWEATSSKDRSRLKSACATPSVSCACARMRAQLRRPRAPSPAAARAHLAPPRVLTARTIHPPSALRRHAHAPHAAQDLGGQPAHWGGARYLLHHGGHY